MGNKCLIVMSDTDLDTSKFNSFFKIGVERGCLDLIEKQISLDLAIADFDHVLNEELGLIKDKAKEFVMLNSDKDFLDGEVAIQEAQKRGFNDIVVIAKPTKRIDMNLSIIHLVNEYNVKIINDTSMVMKLKPGKTDFDFNNYQDYTYITFYSLHDCKITLDGFKYETKDLVMKPNSLNAYSNSFQPYINASIETNKEILVIMSI